MAIVLATATFQPHFDLVQFNCEDTGSFQRRIDSYLNRAQTLFFNGDYNGACFQLYAAINLEQSLAQNLSLHCPGWQNLQLSVEDGLFQLQQMAQNTYHCQ